MPPGVGAPTPIPSLPNIFHNIPYANLVSGAEPVRFGDLFAAVDKMRRLRDLCAVASFATLHG
jgi:hypothetical protein